MFVEEVIQSLVKDPAYFWDDNPRQRQKLQRRVTKAKNRLELTDDLLVQDVIGIARMRLKAGGRAIFLSNIGSSGSHLFQSCIARTWRAIPLGEVYLPPKLVEEVKSFSKEELGLLCEAYLVLHDTELKERYNTTAFILNTLHHPKLSSFSSWSKNYSSALLIRNPVDIAISRTFRKNEYREYLSKDDESDYDYLNFNIQKVKSFYNNAFKFDHNVIIKFEDLMCLEPSVLDSLRSLLLSEIDINFLIAKVSEALNDGASTNKFGGEQSPVPETLRYHATEELKALCERLGYSADI